MADRKPTILDEAFGVGEFCGFMQAVALLAMLRFIDAGRYWMALLCFLGAVCSVILMYRARRLMQKRMDGSGLSDLKDVVRRSEVAGQ